ncbi:MAG: hypothetical protein V4736_14555, partial [Bdellovibrionota bacterium]
MLTRGLILTLLFSIGFQAQSAQQCDRDQVMGMSCTSFMHGEGIGTYLQVGTREFQSCQKGT